MRYNRFKNSRLPPSVRQLSNLAQQEPEEQPEEEAGPSAEEIEADQEMIKRLGWYSIVGGKIFAKATKMLDHIAKKRKLEQPPAEPESPPEGKPTIDEEKKPLKYSELRAKVDEFGKLVKIGRSITLSKEPTTIMQKFNQSQQEGSELKLKAVPPGQIESGIEFLDYYKKVANNLAKEIGEDPEIVTEKDAMVVSPELLEKIKSLQKEYYTLVPKVDGKLTGQAAEDAAKAKNPHS